MNTSLKDNLKENLKGNLDSLKGNLGNLKDNLRSAREDVIAARKCENINDPVDTHFVDYIAMAFSKLFIKLHVIPNVVTMLSMASGVAGGVLLALDRGLGLDLVGALLVFLSAVFDASDGQVARLTRHFSRLGRMLDGMSDATVYISLYIACVIRLWDRSPLTNASLWHGLLIVLGLVTFLLYVAQCQLPDYFKNLHMYMIDNSKGNELSRSKHILAELKQAPRFSFARFSCLCYYLYTRAQERRAPQTQKLLDAVELHGKSDELCDAFYAESRKLVKLTNLLTFNLRTAVLLVCMLLHWELAGLLFVWVVLEPIRLVLLRKYENLARRLLPTVGN